MSNDNIDLVFLQRRFQILGGGSKIQQVVPRGSTGEVGFCFFAIGTK